MWLQMYGYDDAVREPTPDEERAMTYATFIHGTRLLLYWIYKPMSAALWASMKDVRLELERLEAIVLGEGARCLATGVRRGRVHYTLWNTGSRDYLIACNIAPEHVFVRFPLRDRRSVDRIWYDSGLQHAVGGQLLARFRPFARQVWELS
jgi:hypothetical protein